LSKVYVGFWHGKRLFVEPEAATVIWELVRRLHPRIQPLNWQQVEGEDGDEDLE
jgi:hypothetical protein